MNLLKKGIALRLEEHPLPRQAIGAMTLDRSSQAASASIDQEACVFEGVSGPSSTTITLKVALLASNSESNLAQNVPKTSTENSESPVFLEVDVQPSDSLLSVKDKIGVLLMHFRPQWTQDSQRKH